LTILLDIYGVVLKEFYFREFRKRKNISTIMYILQQTPITLVEERPKKTK
jgi:hypothetical protein